MRSACRVALVAATASALFACAPRPTDGFRDTDQPIGASTRYDSTAFAGEWNIVGRFGAPVGGTIGFAPVFGEVEVDSDAASQLTGRYRVGAPGELLPVRRSRETLIIMWVDADFETAAIGTASGSFGAVIDRDGIVPADRAQAARDILDFYGWDTAALQRIDA